MHDKITTDKKNEKTKQAPRIESQQPQTDLTAQERIARQTGSPADLPDHSTARPLRQIAALEMQKRLGNMETGQILATEAYNHIHMQSKKLKPNQLVDTQVIKKPILQRYDEVPEWLIPQDENIPQLPSDERQRLIRLAGDSISMALTAFFAAIEQNRNALHSAARTEAEIISTLIEVVAGPLAPVLTRGIATIFVQLPIERSQALERFATWFQGSDREQLLASRFIDVTRGIRTAIKTNAVSLAGETDTDQFLTRLENATHQEFYNLSANLDNLDDNELAAVVAAFHPNVANIEVYRQRISNLLSRFHQQVEPIHRPFDPIGSAHREIVRVIDSRAEDEIDPSQAPLALVGPFPAGSQVHNTDDFYGDWWLVEWISPDLASAAIARSERLFGHSIRTILRSQIRRYGGTVFSDPPSEGFRR